jgi:hypothetical protein
MYTKVGQMYMECLVQELVQELVPGLARAGQLKSQTQAILLC